MFEGLLGEEGREMAKKASKEEEVIPFLQSRSIKQLSQKNFSKYLGEKEAAFVFFYKPECGYCSAAKPHILKAAKTTPIKTKGGKGYAIVDCSKEQDLCTAEQVHKFPTFKLYVGGKFMSSFDEPPHHDAIKTFVDNAPEPPSQVHSNKKRVREDL